MKLDASKEMLAPPAVCDRFGRALRDLRISVIDACNLRCTYCMPKEQYGERYQFLSEVELLSFDEIVRVARSCAALGTSKIRLTGGEPLLRRGLTDLVSMLAAIEGIEDLALTTNGILLPRCAHDLREAGLNRVTISLDTLDQGVFARMSGRNVEVNSILDGIEAAEACGLHPIKINVVVQRGINDHLIMELVDHFKGKGHALRFIEYMDVGTRNGWVRDEVVSSKELLARIEKKHAVEALEKNYDGEVASRYRFRDGPGEVGFISSVTEPFCGSCTRLRLSAEGKLYTCLFGSTSTDLRRPLRQGASDDALTALVRDVWTRREDRYSELRASSSGPDEKDKRIEMYQIGG